jgi:hypothetical protein
MNVAFNGAVGQGYRLWAGTNFSGAAVTNSWSILTNGVFSGGELFNDPAATNFAQRFYILTMP